MNRTPESCHEGPVTVRDFSLEVGNESERCLERDFFFFLIHLRNLEQLLERVLGIWC